MIGDFPQYFLEENTDIRMTREMTPGDMSCTLPKKPDFSEPLTSNQRLTRVWEPEKHGMFPESL